MSKNLFKGRKLYIPVDIDRKNNFVSDDDIESMVGPVESQKLSYVIYNFKIFVVALFLSFIVFKKVLKKGNCFKMIHYLDSRYQYRIVFISIICPYFLNIYSQTYLLEKLFLALYCP